MTESVRYYAVNDRPVKLVTLADGSVDALVFDGATGGFVPDRGSFARVSESGIGKDVDQLTEAQFEQRVRVLRAELVARLVAADLPWEASHDAEHPYRASVAGHTYQIRINDFPAEPLYTLIADGGELADLEDWPAAWRRP